MNMNGAAWREAKDDMGRSVWLNLSLARSIRRDPKGRGTWVTFDNEHTISVESTVEDPKAEYVNALLTASTLSENASVSCLRRLSSALMSSLCA